MVSRALTGGLPPSAPGRVRQVSPLGGGSGFAAVAPASPDAVAGLAMWIDASTSAGLWQDDARTSALTASGQTIGSASDASGNGRHLIQATSTRRPQWMTGVHPALGCIVPDNVDDLLAWAGDVIGAGTGITIIGACQSLSVSGFTRSPVIVSNATQQMGQMLRTLVAGNVVTARGGRGNVAAVATAGFAATSTSWVTHACVVDGAGGTVLGYLNGSPDAGAAFTGGAMTASTVVEFCLLGSTNSPSPHPIGEVAIYNRALTPAEVAGVHAWLRAKWGTV